MALEEFVFGLAVGIIFTSKGCYASSICGIGGSPGNWPWQASVTRDGAYVCGGTLINNQWILTAAQYISRWGPEVNLVVYLGTTISRLYYNSNVSQAVDAKYCQTSYDYYITYGVCLLRLSSPVTFSPNVQPVCLAERGSTFHTGVSSWVSGWGSVYNGDYTQYSYYDFYSTVVGENECSCRRSNHLPSTTLCAKTEYNIDLRTIGLTLLVQKDSAWVQSGVLTVTCWGYEPCLYSDVSQYQDWIERVVESSTNSAPGFVKFTSWGEDSDVEFKCITFKEDFFISGSQKMVPHFGQLLSLLGLTLLLCVMGK